MKRIFAILLTALIWISCASEAEAAETYTQIDQETAKEMMSRDDGHIVVDVRRQDEYDSGHIPGAVLIPNESIEDEPPAALPDFDQIILIYCRSGNRSKQASEKLADMGYTNIYEFGGINTWTGEIVTAEEETPKISAFSLYRNGAVYLDSYEITLWPDGYHVSVSGRDDQYIDTESVEALMQVIEENDVYQWDGFDESFSDKFGESEVFVLDGEGFWLEFTLTDGTSVMATGYNAFPENYFPVVGELQKILDSAQITPLTETDTEADTEA